jgi:cell division protein FtsB
MKKASIITKLVILALIAYATLALLGMRNKIEDAEAYKIALAEQVEEKRTVTADLQYKIDHKDDRDTIADVARNDLNLVAPGEKVFYNAGD